MSSFAECWVSLMFLPGGGGLNRSVTRNLIIYFKQMVISLKMTFYVFLKFFRLLCMYVTRGKLNEVRMSGDEPSREKQPWHPQRGSNWNSSSCASHPSVHISYCVQYMYTVLFTPVNFESLIAQLPRANATKTLQIRTQISQRSTACEGIYIVKPIIWALFTSTVHACTV